jgi:hypothetical protein
MRERPSAGSGNPPRALWEVNPFPLPLTTGDRMTNLRSRSSLVSAENRLGLDYEGLSISPSWSMNSI